VLRRQVLDAAVDCLAEMPYSEVSTTVVATRAAVSRGGMQYYFPTRLDLLQAMVAYLHDRRLAVFRHDLTTVPANGDAIDHIIESHWRHLHEREFRAYQELVLASRSEPKLASVLAASYRSFLDEWHAIARELIDWDANDPVAARCGNIAHYLLEGMAYGQMAGQLRPEEVRQMLDFVKSVMTAASGKPVAGETTISITL